VEEVVVQAEEVVVAGAVVVVVGKAVVVVVAAAGKAVAAVAVVVVVANQEAVLVAMEKTALKYGSLRIAEELKAPVVIVKHHIIVPTIQVLLVIPSSNGIKKCQ